MAEGTKWFNDDGLNIHFGRREPEKEKPGFTSTMGRKKELVLDFTYVEANADSIITPGETVVTGTSDKTDVAFIPKGAVIESVKLLVGTAFATGTGIEIGLEQLDGTDIDLDGFMASGGTGAVANLTADTAVIGETTLVDTVIANDGYILIAWTGTDATTGTAKLVVEYTI